MACLILRMYLKTTYGGVIELLAVALELREAVRLETVPHYSTLKKFVEHEGMRELMEKAAYWVRPDLLYADAGYDVEWVHAYCVDWGVTLLGGVVTR